MQREFFLRGIFERLLMRNPGQNHLKARSIEEANQKSDLTHVGQGANKKSDLTHVGKM